jgi:uncharacterized membrane protein
MHPLYDGYGYGYGYGAAAFIGFFLVFGLIWFAIVVGGYVLNGFAFMSFYRKVGVKPWIAWVPYYNQFTWLQVGGQVGWFIFLALVPFGAWAVIVFLAIGMYRTGIAMGKQGGWVVLGIFLPFAWAFVMGAKENVYRPELITAAGYGPPLAGYGSAPNYANVDYVAPQYPQQPTQTPPPPAA